jgi:hypothetical protein
MTAKTLKDALHRVEAWPEHAQEMLAELALKIIGNCARVNIMRRRRSSPASIAA